MASDVPPVKGSAYTDYISLISQADANLFQTSVTLASGDVTVSKDGGSFTNIASLPVEIGTGGVLSIALTGTEMTADTIVVRFRDAAGSEWADALIRIKTGMLLPTDSITADSLAQSAVDAIHMAGAGAVTFTYTLTSSVDSAPIVDADIWVTSDQAGNTVIASGTTDSNGQVVFYLDTGTVYVWRQKPGWNFSNPDTETVA